MSIFFALEDKSCNFDSLSQLRHDLDVMTLQIVQKEAQPAQAHLTISTSAKELLKAWLIISVAKPTSGSTSSAQCIFRGTLEDVPKKIHEDLWCITFTAIPEDKKAQLKELLEKHRESPLYEPLFVPEGLEGDPSILALTQGDVLDYDRVSHRLQLVSPFGGTAPQNITNSFYHRSLNLKKVMDPVDAVDVTLKAQWIQVKRGWLNLSQRLSRLFPQGMINTLTGDSFRQSWPKQGKTLGKSGYWVAVSRLEEKDPPSGYAPISLPFFIKQTNNLPQLSAIKRTWFEGRLILGWGLQQKRSETLEFSLNHAYQKPLQDPQEKSLNRKRITIALQHNLFEEHEFPSWMPDQHYKPGDHVYEGGRLYTCQKKHISGECFHPDLALWSIKSPSSTYLPVPEASSFFITKRGNETVGRAIEVAKAYLARHARPLEVTCTLPFWEHMDISTQTLVEIHDSRLPGHQAQGKVVHYEILFDGKTGRQDLSITFAPATGTDTPDQEPPQEKPSPGYSQGYDIDYSFRPGSYKETPGGDTYLDYADQIAQDAYATLDSSGLSLLREARIDNTPEKQEEVLKEHDCEDNPISRKILGSYATRLCLNFHSLATRAGISHNIRVTLLKPWSAPCQINLWEKH
jgi:hypothetical protein